MQSPAAGRVYLKLGRRADGLRVLANVTKPESRVSALQVASLYFTLGDKDSGFEWLSKAFDRREVVLLLKTDVIRQRPFRSPVSGPAAPSGSAGLEVAPPESPHRKTNGGTLRIDFSPQTLFFVRNLVFAGSGKVCNARQSIYFATECIDSMRKQSG